jgi:6-phospho-3-hexuloisomerase
VDARPDAGDRPWLAVVEEVTQTIDALSADSVDRLVRELSDHDGRIFFSGQGRSGLSAQMVAMRFTHLGYRAHAVGEVTAPSIGQGDLLILFSGSGDTAVTVHFAELARSNGARVVAVTTNPDSRLGLLVDLCLTIPIASTRQFGGSLFEQASLIAMDAVVFAIASRRGITFDEMKARHTNLQ